MAQVLKAGHQFHYTIIKTEIFPLIYTESPHQIMDCIGAITELQRSMVILVLSLSMLQVVEYYIFCTFFFCPVEEKKV